MFFLQNWSGSYTSCLWQSLCRDTLLLEICSSGMNDMYSAWHCSYLIFFSFFYRFCDCDCVDIQSYDQRPHYSKPRAKVVLSYVFMFYSVSNLHFIYCSGILLSVNTIWLPSATKYNSNISEIFFLENLIVGLSFAISNKQIKKLIKCLMFITKKQ